MIPAAGADRAAATRRRKKGGRALPRVRLVASLLQPPQGALAPNEPVSFLEVCVWVNSASQHIPSLA